MNYIQPLWLLWLALCLPSAALAEVPVWHSHIELDTELTIDEGDASFRPDNVYSLQAWVPVWQNADTVIYLDGVGTLASSEADLARIDGLVGVRHMVNNDIAVGASALFGQARSMDHNNFSRFGFGAELIAKGFDLSTVFVLPVDGGREAVAGGHEKAQKFLASSAGYDFHPPFVDVPGHVRVQGDLAYALGSGDNAQDYFFGDIELQYSLEASFLGDYSPDSLLVFGLGTPFSNGDSDGGQPEVDVFDHLYGKVSLRVPLAFGKIRGDTYSKNALEQKLNRSLTDSIPTFMPTYLE